MDDFKSAKAAMIDSQLRPSGVTDARFLAAVSAVPRELFVAENRRSVAYVDDLQRLGSKGRFFLSPTHFGRLARLAEIKADHHVLVIGAASGYSVAVISKFAQRVVGLEFDPDLADAARKNLEHLGIPNAQVLSGDFGVLGDQLFDAILIEGALEDEPDDILPLLAIGGRLVAPILHRGVAVVKVFSRSREGVMFTSEFDATIPRLRNWAVREEFVF